MSLVYYCLGVMGGMLGCFDFWEVVGLFSGMSSCWVVRWRVTHRGLLGDQTLPLWVQTIPC